MSIYEAIDEVNEALAVHGGACEIVDIDPQGVLYLELVGGCAGCPSSQLTMYQVVRPLLLRVPEITEVVLHAGSNSRKTGASS